MNRVEQLETALRDAVSTYKGSDKIVTAERIEAWESALAGNKACFNKNPDLMCSSCDCWKSTRATCS